MVPSTVINTAGQDQSLVDDLNIIFDTISVRIALRNNPLRSIPYAGDLRGGFWKRLFKNIF